jgi:Pyruvate/2-oxoacid:ferredoxin oxidoreductase delta subunit
MFLIDVNEDACKGCGNCIVACPVNSLKSLDIRGGKGGDPAILTCENGNSKMVSAEFCNGCGICEDVCSSKAIKVISVEAMKFPDFYLTIEPEKLKLSRGYSKL